MDSFYNWSVDATRKAGDADVIESEYGYHVMYYVGDSELSYRDTLILDDMETDAINEWSVEILDGITLTEGNLSRIETGIILYSSSSSS